VRAGEEGKVHPGADDNASGVAAILEIARLLKAQKPARTVVFAAFSGEEAGLLGARHYIEAARAAGFAYPLSRVVANINLDTVGRLEQGRIRILGTDTAREWSTLFTESAAQTAAPLEVVGQDLGGSDQKAFVEAGVPGVQVFASTAVDYHRPTDTADKVDIDGVAKVTALVKEAVVRLAGAPQGLTFIPPQAAPAAAAAPTDRPRRVATGLVPDMAYQGKGVRAGSVADGSGAAQAGLRPGDVVIAMGGKPIDDLRGLSEALKTFVPAQDIDVQFIRDGKTHTVPMRLGAR
jgi:Zn-dependent M28 family amino/carboxypeptidase